jgi:hypothetical protein
VAEVYEMTSRWEINASREELWDVFDELLYSSDPLPWWSALHVLSNDGATMSLKARSPIGYTLRFRVHDLMARKPVTLTYASDGDLRGNGSTTFHRVSANACALDFKWNVSVDRAWMRATSLLLRPLFVLGHDRVMAQGEKNLNAWLAKRAKA